MTTNPNETTDQQFIESIKSKDSNGIRNFVASYSDMIFQVCLQYLPIKEDAEDLVQSIFITIIEKIDTFKSTSTLKTWIYRIAVNECLQQIRYRQRKRRFAFFSSVEDVTISTGIDQLPDIQLEEKERLKKLYNIIDSLPENQRTAFSLQNIQDLTHKEIAEIMDVSVSSVESLLFRARKKLKEKLKSPQDSDKKGI